MEKKSNIAITILEKKDNLGVPISLCRRHCSTKQTDKTWQESFKWKMMCGIILGYQRINVFCQRAVYSFIFIGRVFKGAYWIIQQFLVHYQILYLSNISIPILDFSLLLLIKLLLLKGIAKKKGKIIALCYYL